MTISNWFPRLDELPEDEESRFDSAKKNGAAAWNRCEENRSLPNFRHSTLALPLKRMVSYHSCDKLKLSEKDPEDNMETGIRQIHGSRRQVMDWSLVLASQEIETTILRHEQQWALEVSETDHPRAVAAIQQYRLENRGWRWRQPLPRSGADFHWASLLWVFALSTIYVWSTIIRPAAVSAGLMDNQGVSAGQWWRVFTAISLHGDLGHLLANLTAGVLLLGLAMGRYGAGAGALAAYLAGAVGNLAGYIFYNDSHRSLGASGMVMGALGLIAVQSFAHSKKYPQSLQVLLRSLGTGVFLLILWGTSPGSDVLAHAGGFVGGCILGLLLSLCPEKWLENRPANRLAVAALLALFILTWWLALRSSP